VLARVLSLPPLEAHSVDRAAFEAAREICRRHARSFFFASHFLPVEKRYAAYAVYAFCRLVDDAVDQEGDQGESRARDAAGGTSVDAIESRLARFAAVLDDAYARRPAPPTSDDESHLALHAFALTVRRYRITKQHFLDLAAGCRLDLTVRRYETWADLERYCYLVAGVVGLILCPIFGLSDPSAAGRAVLMGNAMQLTNILRDVREDWDRGRLYLPREDLDRFGYTEWDVAGRVVDDRLRRLMKFEVARARDLYRRGAEGLASLANDGSRVTASAMAVIYGGILGAIERQGYDVYRGRAHLTTGDKLARLPVAWRLARRDAGEPLPEFV
jgi:phytoene synthase